MDEKPAQKSFVRWLTFPLVAAACWLVVRSCEYGIPNVFFRDHHFTDARPLNEGMAIDLTRQTLEAEGFDVSSMKPRPFYPSNPDVFARNSIDPNQGYVLWGDPHSSAAWEYLVSIEKNGSEVRCRVSRPK
jgi:hypothetical protein